MDIQFNQTVSYMAIEREYSRQTEGPRQMGTHPKELERAYIQERTREFELGAI